jgi:hypothetical protein
MFLTSFDGAVIDSLGPLDPGAGMLSFSLGGEGGRGILPQPFSHRDYTAVDPTGAASVIVRTPGSKFNPHQEAFEVEFIDSRGRRVHRVSTQLERLRPEAVRAWIARTAETVGNRYQGSRASARDAIGENLYRPSYHPPVREALIGPDGVLWLLQSPSGATRDRWMLVSPSGRVERTVEFPAGSRVLTVSGHAAWVVESDDDGNQNLVRYRF